MIRQQIFKDSLHNLSYDSLLTLFVPRLELLTLLGIFRDFLKGLKMSKMKHFSIFCKLCLVLFLTLIMALRFYAAPLQIWDI